MPRLWQSILSLWAWFVLVVCILLWFPLMIIARLVTAPFDRGRYYTGYLFRRIGPVMAALNPLWRFRYSGALPPDPRRPFVVVSNHESFADILLISHLPWEMKWLSKAELFRIPVMGWMMWLAGDIPIKRGFGPSAVEAMERCREVLARRVSVMIFPEGTRSKT
ncbi:MAG TPA: lysophospholipid acyltransferase family protein, partial [Gemmatimonadales bacterium]